MINRAIVLAVLKDFINYSAQVVKEKCPVSVVPLIDARTTLLRENKRQSKSKLIICTQLLNYQNKPSDAERVRFTDSSFIFFNPQPE